MGMAPLTATLSYFCFLPLTLFYAGVGRNDSNGRHSKDFVEQEVKTATQSLGAPCASELTGKEGSYCT